MNIKYEYFEYYENKDAYCYRPINFSLVKENNIFNNFRGKHPIKYIDIRFILNSVDFEIFFDKNITYCYDTAQYINSADIEELINYALFI